MFRLLLSLAIIFSLSAAPAFAKAPPPGTGADDVPANILLMLDNSDSMADYLNRPVLQYPIDFAFDASGNLFVANYFDVVEKYDSSGTLITYWGDYGNSSTLGTFDLISGLDVDSAGNVYVNSRNDARLQKFDNDGNSIAQVAMPVRPAQGLAIDASDNVYSIDGNGDVHKYDSSLNHIATWPLGDATGIAISNSGSVFITNYVQQTVSIYNTSGALQSKITLGWSPRGIEVDNAGDLYISEPDDNSVFQYSQAGVYLNSWESNGKNPGEFLQPEGIARHSDGTMYIADHLNNRIQDVNGNLLVANFQVPLTKLDIAKDVIKSIVSDSNLTSGAHFGLMSWNTNPTMITPVSATGASEIYTDIDPVTTTGGTELDNAMDLAQTYFLGASSPMDPSLACQENILIVISDGFWTDNTASSTAQYLYDTYGIRTFTVGFLTQGNDNYITLSQAGGTYPESPLYADNQDALFEVLSGYIQQVISSNLTFSAPTIIPSTASDESILQSIFTHKNNHQWKGRLLKYELTTTGDVGNLLWDAGEQLNSTPADNRNIWTVSTGLVNGINNFVTANSDRLRVPIEEFSGSVITPQALDEIIEFIRGKDAYGEFPTGFDDEGDTLLPGERWKLADVYHSKASIVGEPSAYFSDESHPNSESYYRHVNNYLGFKQGSDCGVTCTSRDEVIYVGSNSGMLHAFDSATGDELWGFIPPSLLGSLKNTRPATAGQSISIFGVDGSPTIKDIYYGGKWRTVLMSGLRQGGHSYFALDVTDPHDPKHLFTFAYYPSAGQISYWRADGTRTDYGSGFNLGGSGGLGGGGTSGGFSTGGSTSGGGSSIPTEYNYSKLGEAWSQPVIVKAHISGSDKWVAVIAGGYNNAITSEYGNKLYIIDLENEGEILKDINLQDIHPSNGIVNSAPPKVTAITADSTTQFNDKGALIYVTDLEGKVWIINLTDQGILYQSTKLFGAFGTVANDRYGFHELAASMSDTNNLMLYFGTGNLQSLGRKDTTIANRIFGIKESNFPNYASVSPMKNAVANLDNTTSSGTCPDLTTKDGWFLDLPANEKVTAKVAVANNTVFVSLYTPHPTDDCSPGTARLLEIDYLCGNTLRSTDLGGGVPTGAVVYENKVYIGVSDDSTATLGPEFTKTGNLITGNPSEDGETKTFIETWKEDFR